jgi:hypothetical protein
MVKRPGSILEITQAYPVGGRLGNAIGKAVYKNNLRRMPDDD